MAGRTARADDAIGVDRADGEGHQGGTCQNYLFVIKTHNLETLANRLR